MKEGGVGKHIFGDAKWWGKELFGIDNALVGDWPVVVIRDGKATIAEYRSIPAWWDKHSDAADQAHDRPRPDVGPAHLIKRQAVERRSFSLPLAGRVA